MPCLEESILQAHDPQTDRTPQSIRSAGLFGRIPVAVDNVVERFHHVADSVFQPLPIYSRLRDKVADVDGSKIANSRVLGVSYLKDFGAEVGRVDYLVAMRSDLRTSFVGPVLEGHPTVARFGEGTHHAGVEVTRGHGRSSQSLAFVVAVTKVEVFAVGIVQVGNIRRVEKGPIAALEHPLHEQVRNPVGEVEIVRAAGLIARVVLQLQKLPDISVPGLQVHAAGTLAATALSHCENRGVEGVQPGHDAVGLAVGALDMGAARAHTGPRGSDASCELRQLSDLAVLVVDAFQRVLRRVEQVAGRHLRVHRARVVERRRARETVKVREDAVDFLCVVRVRRDAASHSEKEKARVLDKGAGGVPQEVAVQKHLCADVAHAGRLTEGAFFLQIRLHAGCGVLVEPAAFAAQDVRKLQLLGPKQALDFHGSRNKKQVGRHVVIRGVLGNQLSDTRRHNTVALDYILGHCEIGYMRNHAVEGFVVGVVSITIKPGLHCRRVGTHQKPPAIIGRNSHVGKAESRQPFYRGRGARANKKERR